MNIFLLIHNKCYADLKKLINEKPKVIDPNQFPSPLQQAINEQDLHSFEIILQGMFDHNYLIELNESMVKQYILYCQFTGSEFEKYFLKKIPRQTKFYDAWMNEILNSYLERLSYACRKKEQVPESVFIAIKWLLSEINLDFNKRLLQLVSITNLEKHVIEFLTILLDHNTRKNPDNYNGVFNSPAGQFLEHTALFRSYSAMNFEVAKFLLKRNLDTKLEHRGVTEIHLMLNAFFDQAQEEVISLAFQKFGGIERFKDHNPGLLSEALLQWKIDSAKLLLKLGFKLEWTMPLREITYLEFCIRICLDYKHPTKRNQMFRFLKEHINIEDPKLWESANLSEEAAAQNWDVCEILLKLNRDPYECDRFGEIAVDKITPLLSNEPISDAFYFENESYERIINIASLLKEKMRVTKGPSTQTEQLLEQAKSDPHPKIKKESDIREEHCRNLYEQVSTIAREIRERHIRFKDVSYPSGKGAYNELMSGLCYQTVSQHNAVLWSLTQHHSMMYFKKRMSRKPIEKSYEIAGTVLKFRDWTRAKNYKFIVHTTSGVPEVLAKTLETGAEFIRTTEFFSCSFIDKDIPPAIMEHQVKTIFPFSLMLKLQDDAVEKAFHTDAWSPMLTRVKEKQDIKSVSEKYFAELKEMDEEYHLLTMLTQALTRNHPSFTNPTSLSTLDSEMILNILMKHAKYKIPSAGFFGYVPGLSPLSTLKATHKDSFQSRFNEIIVKGRPKNEVIAVLVDEVLLNEFIDHVQLFSPEKLQDIKKSLQLLATSKFPLILIRTAENGYYNKRTLFQKYEAHYREIQETVKESEPQFMKQQRLATSRFAALDIEATKPLEDKLYAVLKKVEHLKRKMGEIHRQIEESLVCPNHSKSSLALC